MGGSRCLALGKTGGYHILFTELDLLVDTMLLRAMGLQRLIKFRGFQSPLFLKTLLHTMVYRAHPTYHHRYLTMPQYSQHWFLDLEDASLMDRVGRGCTWGYMIFTSVLRKLLTSYIVWSFKILYWIGPTAHEFSIRTNLEWNLFQRLAQTYLRITILGNHFGHRVIRGGTSETLCYLRGLGDWKYVLDRIRVAAGEGCYEAMEIANVSVSTLCPWC